MIIKIWSHCMLQWEVLYNCFSMYYQAIRLVSKHGTEHRNYQEHQYVASQLREKQSNQWYDVCSHMCSVMFLEQVQFLILTSNLVSISHVSKYSCYCCCQRHFLFFTRIMTQQCLMQSPVVTMKWLNCSIGYPWSIREKVLHCLTKFPCS